MTDSVMIICPPLSDFPEPPKDQSHSEKFDCTKCKGKMWLSDKKKGVLLFSACSGKKIILRCYPCAKNYFEENSGLFDDIGKIDL